MNKKLRSIIKLMFVAFFLIVTSKAHAQIYLVGDATPGGWDLAAQTEMTAQGGDVFTWTGSLTSGSFKIKTYSAEDFCAGDWVHPKTGSAPLESADVDILLGCDSENPDNQWAVSADTTLTISVNLTDSTISFSEAQVTADPVLFMVGDATPGGWDLASQTELTLEGDSLFTWSGTLTSGAFKFKTYPEQDFCAGDWVHPTVASAPLEDAQVAILLGCDSGNPDNQWSVSSDTTITITVDLKNTSISFSEFSETQDPSKVAYLVGSATPGGWDLAEQTPMTQSEADTNIFVYSDTLLVGEFKIKLYEASDFCAGDWLHPTEAAQDFANTEADILAGCAQNNPDYKWEVTEAGIYTVTANLNDTTLTVVLDESFNITFDELFLIGSATPGGWDLSAQTPMTKDMEDDAVFTWTGDLVAGELKIKTYAAEDFCGGETIHPTSASAPLTSTDIEILIACSDSNPDYKWEVSEADTGEYMVTVNLDSASIKFEKLSSTSNENDGSEIADFRLHQNYPNPFNPSTNITFELPENSVVRLNVYNMLGRKVATLVNELTPAGSHTINFDASTMSSGVYIYTLQTGASTITRKMMLIK